jgi:hypothetical protein
MDLYLNTDIMNLITEFLSPTDAGRMACLNHAWKTYMYRDKIWNRFNWRISTEMKVLGITDKSVHCGEKRRDCFWHWVAKYHSFRDGGILSLNRLYRLWQRNNKPCTILFHYLPATCFLYNFTEAEQKTFLKKHIVYGASQGNSYAQYVMRVCRNVFLDNGGGVLTYWASDQNELRNRLVILDTTPKKTSVDEFESKLIKIDMAELKHIQDEYYRIYTVLQKCITKLSLYTSHVFHQNHMHVLNYNDSIWNSIYFSLPVVEDVATT